LLSVSMMIIIQSVKDIHASLCDAKTPCPVHLDLLD
jgi:hypothetical protein